MTTRSIGASSCAPKSRPIAGVTPSMAINAGEICIPVSLTASPRPDSVIVEGR
jgi:hypothetical protein